MLLTINIGNSNIIIGAFEAETLVSTFRMTTIERSSDEYGVLLCDMLRLKGLDIADIKDVIIACVVPKMLHSFTNAIIKYFNVKPMIVGPGVKSGIKLEVDNPKEIGAGRIADIAGARAMYENRALLVIDFATATTYDLVKEDGTFFAGVTAPGMKIAVKAMSEYTAMLPGIEIEKPNTILSKNTVSSMQAGQIGQTEYIVKKMLDEAKLTDVLVVATGGLGKLIAENTDIIDEYNPNLTLLGLRSIWSKNVNRKC